MKQRIELTKRDIVTCSGMRELENLGIVTKVPITRRHRVFEYMQYGKYRAYRGGWGPEHIRWDGEGAAYVHATTSRAREIELYISDQLFGDHNA